MSKIFKDPAYRNVGIIAALSFLQALQLLMYAAAIFSFIPFKQTDFVTKIFPVYLPEVRPEREMLLFRLFVVASLGIMAAWIARHKKNMDDDVFYKKILPYAMFTACCIFVQMFFIFKFFVWGGPLWSKVMMYLSMISALFAHIFWPELKKVITRISWRVRSIKQIKSPALWDGSFILLLIVLLYPYNLDNVLGRMFVHDQFYHLDGMLMTPSWAFLKGLALNQDIISQYSIGMPAMMANVLGSNFDYPAVIVCIIGICLFYYVALYAFMVVWLESRPLAVFGTLLAVKLQMFHWGVAPLIWQFPTATPFRYLPDIFFLFVLWRHMHASKLRASWPLLAGLIFLVGFSLFWMADVGVYLLCALVVYCLFWDYRKIPGVLLGVVGTAIFLYWLIVHGAVFKAQFWQHQFEHAALFVNGWGALPMTEGLKEKQFFAFIMGFMIPVVYVGNMLYSGARFWFDKHQKEYLFLVVLSVYGLGLYHYFIHRSGVTSYYVVCIPFVLIVCFWLGQILAKLPVAWQRLSAVGVAGLMLPILLTSYLFTFYPNILNIGGNDWSVEAKYYREHFDFTKDASLIKGLTKPKERVAILSSFETKILMQADRAPFFYYSPLVESSLMDDPQARLTYLHTYARLKATIDQIARQKPMFIFIEKKMLQQKDQVALAKLLQAIEQEYVPLQEGQNLIAFKRKDT